jgi:hypothetical protein
MCEKNVSILFHAVFKEISVHALLCSIDCPQLSQIHIPAVFGVNGLFPFILSILHPF